MCMLLKHVSLLCESLNVAPLKRASQTCLTWCQTPSIISTLKSRLHYMNYDAQNTITKMRLSYIKIDVCKYDCMLYWGQDAELDRCKRCNTRRYKKQKEGSSRSKKLSRKSMRYFPLRGRLQRLFLSRQTAEHMCWHHRERNNDGKMRHPRDDDAWKAFNNEFPDFAGEPRNVRLGLASDGFNPFGVCNQKHSICPVVLIPYNLPPWMCM